MIQVSLLGRVAVTVDGEPLSGEAAQRRRIALLALLCVPKPQPIRRDRLMLYLWPDSDTESARHLLSVAVHVLRKAVGHEVLLTTTDEVALEPKSVHTDVAVFEEALAHGDPEGAVAAYGGPFMDGFHAGAGVELEQWVDGERARLQRLYAQALEGVAAKRRAAGDLAGAVEAWHKRAALDPYSSQGALGLMRALAEAGDRAAAIRHAGIHRQLLEAELGAGPDPEVEALAEQLRTEGASAHVRAGGAGRKDGGAAGRRETAEAAAGGREGAALPAGAGAWAARAAGAEVRGATAGGEPAAGATSLVPAAVATSLVQAAGATSLVQASGVTMGTPDSVTGAGVPSGAGAPAEAPVRGSTRPGGEARLGPRPRGSWARWRGMGRRRWGRIVVAGSLLLLAGYVAVRWRASARLGADAGPRTLAVLPFAVVGQLQDSLRYLGEGVADAILNELDGVEGLKVVARSSSFAVRGERGERPDVRDVGKRLGVNYLLDGSLASEGGRIRISVELLNTRNGFREWRHHYDRNQGGGGLFALQEEIARAVAAELGRKVARGRPAPPDLEAYHLYMRARYAWYQRSPWSLAEAIVYFRRAVAGDSTYALAYAGLAEALAVAGGYDYGALAPDSAYPAARAAALRALALDSTVAAAHSALASVAMNYDWDRAAAEREFRRAIELEPSYSTAHQWYGLLLLTEGRDSQAFEQMQRAGEGDPLSPAMFVQRAHFFYYTHEYGKALEEIGRALQIDSTFGRAHLLLALTQIQLGQAARAVPRMEQMRAAAPEPVVVAVLGYAYARAGQVARARAVRAELAATARTRYVPEELFALLDTALGDHASALDDLERAYRLHSNGMIYLSVEPPMDPLRGEPRFVALERAVAAGRPKGPAGLPQERPGT